MADAVVSFLLNKLGLFVEQETTLLSGVEDDAFFIKEELERINAFLRVTGSMEEVDPQLGIWINQVRNLAFDIEDVVDEFNLRLAQNDQGECSVRKTIQGFKTLKYRRQITSKFRRFKSRVISISEGHERYKLDFPNRGTSFTARNSTWQERRGDALLLDDDDLVGIDESKGKLVNWLVEEEVPAFRVISVVGMGGLGKTTLVKKVYDDVARQKHFRSHAWITVSQSFKLEELLKSIIRQLYKESMEATPQEMETMDSLGLKETIKKYLQDRRYLIVLDDVWDQGAWDTIKHAFPKKHGNRVMLTTRNQKVANNASCFEFEGEVFSLEPLSWEMSWQLFCKKIFYGRDCPSHLEGIAEQILKRCEGLPLAIVTLSGILATKNQNSIDEWEMVKQSLDVELENDKLISMTKILSLSYYELPFHLKACLLHVSMIPEDYEIVCEWLVRLWIAEEIVNEVKGKTMEEVGESYLNELLHRNLLQVDLRDGAGAVKRCRMHDMLREVVVSKCKDQSFAMIVNEKNKEWPTKARRLAIQYTLGDWDGRNNNMHILSGGLRSLMLFCIDDLPPLKSSFGKLDLKMVKVLEMSETNLEKFPNEITKLYHLRFLNLSYTNVSVIPASIGKLLNLVTLYLINTRVTKLPSTIRNLGRLRHLFVYNKQKVPSSISKLYGFDAKFPGIGYLHSLQVLWYIELKKGGGDHGITIIEEIGKLRQLRELGILNLKKQDGTALCSSLDKLPHLHKLAIGAASVVNIAGEEEILELHNISSPPMFLQDLTLRGRLEKVPHWISALSNLAVLRLIGSRVRGDNNNLLKALKGLPNLVQLNLYCTFEGNELCFEVGGFQKLNRLWLSNLQAMTRMVVEDGALPLLEKLFIHECLLMDSLPLGIQNLSTLKLLEFQDVSDTLIETIDRRSKGGGGDFWRIQHIQQVNVFRYNQIERKWIELPL